MQLCRPRDEQKLRHKRLELLDLHESMCHNIIGRLIIGCLVNSMTEGQTCTIIS